MFLDFLWANSSLAHLPSLNNNIKFRARARDDNRRNVGAGAEAELSKVPDYKFKIFMIVSVAWVLHLYCLHPVTDILRFIPWRKPFGAHLWLMNGGPTYYCFNSIPKDIINIIIFCFDLMHPLRIDYVFHSFSPSSFSIAPNNFILFREVLNLKL